MDCEKINAHKNAPFSFVSRPYSGTSLARGGRRFSFLPGLRSHVPARSTLSAVASILIIQICFAFSTLLSRHSGVPARAGTGQRSHWCLHALLIPVASCFSTSPSAALPPSARPSLALKFSVVAGPSFAGCMQATSQ